MLAHEEEQMSDYATLTIGDNYSTYGESIIGLRVSSDTASTSSDAQYASASSTLNIRASSGTYNFPLPPNYDHRHGPNMSQSASSLTVLIPSRDAKSPNRNSTLSQDSIPLPSSTYLDHNVEEPVDWVDVWNLPRASSELMRHADLSETSLSAHHDPGIGSAM